MPLEEAAVDDEVCKKNGINDILFSFLVLKI